MTNGRERSFDDVADEYDRTRPSYPAELLDALPLSGDVTVLDLGAGTGKLTRVLVKRYREVIAVEPLENMRGILERALPGVQALPGSAERIPLDDASVDGVFVAQAFHWFDKDAALPEIARVLRPGGVVAVIWNGPDEGKPSPLPAEFRAELEKLHDAAPKPWEQEPELPELLAGTFVDVHPDSTVPHDHVLDRAALIDNLRSISWIASLPDREAVVMRLAELVPEGTYAVPNLAHVVWAVRA